MYRLLSAASLAIAAGILPVSASYAAGPYDGTWVVDAPQAGGRGGGQAATGQCEALRLQMQVQDNRIVGDMRRSTTGSGRVETTPGRGSSPVSGIVAPDGTFNAQWESLRATGKFTGDKVEMQWNGACGPRTAQGTRSTTEGAGSTSH